MSGFSRIRESQTSANTSSTLMMCTSEVDRVVARGAIAVAEQRRS